MLTRDAREVLALAAGQSLLDNRRGQTTTHGACRSGDADRSRTYHNHVEDPVGARHDPSTRRLGSRRLERLTEDADEPVVFFLREKASDCERLGASPTDHTRCGENARAVVSPTSLSKERSHRQRHLFGVRLEGEVAGVE